MYGPEERLLLNRCLGPLTLQCLRGGGECPAGYEGGVYPILQSLPGGGDFPASYKGEGDRTAFLEYAHFHCQEHTEGWALVDRDQPCDLDWLDALGLAWREVRRQAPQEYNSQGAA